MRKPAQLLILFVFLFIGAKAQEDTEKLKDFKDNQSKQKKLNPAERKEFYSYYLPSSIAKLDFAPAIISILAFDFGEDEITFKVGQPFKKTTDSASLKDSNNKSFSDSWFIGGSLVADEGVKKIVSGGNVNPGYTFRTGITIKKRDRRWVYSMYPDSTSSRQYRWMNAVLKLNWTPYNIFAADTLSYKKQDPFGFQILVSYSSFFHSEIKKYQIGNCIWSGGLGFGRFSNYSILGSEMALSEGRLLSNGNFIQTDEVKGKMGDFKNFFAGVYFFDYYKSIIRAPKATLYLGARANGYIGQYANINTNIGLYFSKTDTADKKKEEKIGFVLAANFPNTQKFDWNKYFKDKVYVSFAAILPLKFGL